MILNERLQQLKNRKVQVVTNGHHVAFTVHKGILVIVEEDYVELDSGGKIVILPLVEISSIIVKD